jgi:hypothetical protein
MATKQWDPTKPDLWEVPALDTARLAQQARRWVDGLLHAAKSREDRLARAVELADEWTNAEAATRGQRDKIALAIEAHFNVRRGAAMHSAIGVNRTRWLEMRTEGAGGKHPKRLADLDLLTKAAADTYEARQIAAYARDVRDAIVRELADEGMTNVELAELIGRNPSQVSHIKYPGRPRPKPRPKDAA